MIPTDSATTALWATKEFGSAQLRNTARTRRVIRMGARVAEAPAGRVTQVFTNAAEREGAYRFLENDAIDARGLADAAARASARRSSGQLWVYIPVDGSSLNLPDPGRIRGVGSIGTRRQRARGLKVMSAIAVSPDGTAVGLANQVWWARSDRRRRDRTKRCLAEKETRYWLEVINNVRRIWREQDARSLLWFQLDREGDFHEMLSFAAAARGCFVTVRSGQNRRVRDKRGRKLKALMRKAPVQGAYTLEVPSTPHRKARRATLCVRARRVTLQLTDKRTHRRYETSLHAVYVRESRTTPYDESPIEWMLLTNYRVGSLASALAVVTGYAQRWKIEQFHRCWKTSCRVEDTQLRSFGAITKWATLLACAAMRIERLRDLARNSPELPASTELTRHELDALVLLREPSWEGQPETLSIKQAVRWIADIGGYTGKSSGRLPGATVIGRGLRRLEPAAIALRNQAKRQAPPGPKT